MSEEKKIVELNDEELEKVNGGAPEDFPGGNSDPFIGLTEGVVYEAKPGGECDYCKIKKIDKNTDSIDYWPGILVCGCIHLVYPVRHAKSDAFRKQFMTEKIINIPWRDF